MTMPSATPTSTLSPTPAAPMTRAALELLLGDSPFQRVLGLSLESFDLAAQTLTLRAAYGPAVERQPGTGQYHGGVIASLIDIAGDFALIAVLGYGVPTINFRVDYLRPAIKTGLITTATVRRAGKSVGVVDVDVFNDKMVLLAVGRATYSTLAA